MEEYLYRYISFESFVGLVQNKALTLVLPELWDDPKESAPFYELIKTTGYAYESIMLFAVYNKTYSQCWTRLSESDAMWRIYSYSNRAIRLEVSVENLKKLQEIDIVPVQYSDEIVIDKEGKKEAFLQSLAIKRVAFHHEKEVRLIKHYKFKDDDDMERHVKAFLAISKPSKGVEIAESMFPGLSMEEQIKRIAQIANEGNMRRKTMDVSFENIPNFFESIKVHPLAPDWYVDIVEEYCIRNDIPFAGKSTLYADE